MKPLIHSTEFGSITIEKETYDHDVLIRLDGKVQKRNKKLSKEIYGTSHILSLPEAKFIYEETAETLIVGAGQDGLVHLSKEAQQYFAEKQLRVVLAPTPKAIDLWNEARGKTIGVFHVTC